MAYSLVTHGFGNSTTGNGFTSGSFNTTGSDLVVVSVATGATTTAVLSDSFGNTWTGRTLYLDTFSDRSIRLYYCQNPTVGAGHTFTIVGNSTFPAITFTAWSGSATSPFDVENGNTIGGFATSITTGSITPTANNELLIAVLQWDDTVTPTVNGGFTISDTVPTSSTGYTWQQMAYLVQTTAAAANPTFSWTSAARCVAAIASFKTSAGAASPVGRLIQIRQSIKRASYW